MKYAQYLFMAGLRKLKGKFYKPKFLDFFKGFVSLDKPILCLTHDLDCGYSKDLNRIIDLEKKYGVSSTMFLLNNSLPPKEWVFANKGKWDMQMHLDFISRGRKSFVKDVKDVNKLIGRDCKICRCHQYELPSLELISPYFKMDSTYDNWSNLSFIHPFLTSTGVIEVPHFPEIELYDMYKKTGDKEKILKVLDPFLSSVKKENGVFCFLAHPTQFKDFGGWLEEELLTKDFDVVNMMQLLDMVEKKNPNL